MGLFDRFTQKKVCALCGSEIGLLGNRKLEDGDMCKECERKLSPFFTNRRHTTVQNIKEQLQYREENKAKVAAFTPTLTLGTGTLVMVDEAAGKVIITRARNWREANPDVFDFADICGCDWRVDEDREELFRTDAKGEEVPYNPPRYEYEYDFYVTIHFNHPYASDTTFKVNQSKIEHRNSAEYRSIEGICKDMKEALTGIRTSVAEAKRPKAAVVCPHCMATTVGDESGRCEYCGGALS